MGQILLTKEGWFILKIIRNHITYILRWLKISLNVH